MDQHTKHDWLPGWLWTWSRGIEVRLQAVERHREEARDEHRAIARRLQWLERGAQIIALIAISALWGLAPDGAEAIASLISALARR